MSISTNTFKPKKLLSEGNRGYQLNRHAQQTLGNGDLRQAVCLPHGEDLNEWLAVNTIDFYNQINLLYGQICDDCTAEKCPVMSAGPNFEYHWADGVTIKKPIKVPAQQYVDYLMTWVQGQMDDEAIFPSKQGHPFPSNFRTIIVNIFKRLFRVFAHMYHHHMPKIAELSATPQLNTSFKHFMLFVREFELIADAGELEPLKEVIDTLLG